VGEGVAGSAAVCFFTEYDLVESVAALQGVTLSSAVRTVINCNRPQGTLLTKCTCTTAILLHLSASPLVGVIGPIGILDVKHQPESYGMY